MSTNTCTAQSTPQSPTYRTATVIDFPHDESARTLRVATMRSNTEQADCLDCLRMGGIAFATTRADKVLGTLTLVLSVAIFLAYALLTV